MERKLIYLVKSFKYIFYFYVPIFILALICIYKYQDVNLSIAILIALGSNLFLGVFTQISNYTIEKYSVADKSREFLYFNFTDCFFRSGAGLSEIILYTICFSTGLETIVAGYLLLKTVSIWQDNVNNKKEGLHTSILRIAIVISLVTSLWASYYVKKFINN